MPIGRKALHSDWTEAGCEEDAGPAGEGWKLLRVSMPDREASRVGGRRGERDGADPQLLVVAPVSAHRLICGIKFSGVRSRVITALRRRSYLNKAL